MKKTIRILILFLLVIVVGCAGFPLKTTDVIFEDPYAKLLIHKVEPNLEEKLGVELKIVPPPTGVEKSREENTIYALIKNGKGLQLKFTLNHLDRYTDGSRPDSFILLSETTLEGEKGSLLEEKEISQQGEILKFIRGFHHSQIGKFKITKWTRTPVFPKGKIKIGDKWSYEESMEVEIDSKWIKEIDPTPYLMKAESILEGFAMVRDKRCAVIHTKTEQRKHEHFKILFKTFKFDIEAKIEERMYLDYQTGTLRAKITQTSSRTSGEKMPMTDAGQSQSLFYQIEA
jgi:hypothetical protein